MKPEWKDAPKWAQWLAQDYNGEWYWYENKPILRKVTWKADDGEMQNASPFISMWDKALCIPMWDKSLEQRP